MTSVMTRDEAPYRSDLGERIGREGVTRGFLVFPTVQGEPITQVERKVAKLNEPIRRD